MAGEGHVILVRHARPMIEPGVDAAMWLMDPASRSDVEAIGSRIASLASDVVVTSDERKARSTGSVIGDVSGLPVRVDPDLGEQGAGTVPWLANERDFQDRVFEHFRRPDERVFGDEASASAAARFTSAVNRWVADHQCPVLVSHGRVMSAYIAALVGTDAVDFWRDLRMPDAIVVDIRMRRWWRIDKEG